MKVVCVWNPVLLRSKYLAVFFLGMMSAVCLGAEEDLPSHHSSLSSTRAIVPATVSVLASSLAQADVAVCRSVINTTHLKGDYAEAMVGRFYLAQHLRASGQWQAVTPRLGRQGLDHVFIRRNGAGEPRSLMTAETKFGTSRLGNTADGRQMSSRWQAPRLRAMGNRFARIARNPGIRVARRPHTLMKREIPVVLKNGRKVYFWQEHARAPWKFDGNGSDLRPAREILARDGRFLTAAGEGKIAVRGRVFRLTVENDRTLLLRSSDIKSVGAGGSVRPVLNKEFRIPLKGSFNRMSDGVLRQEIAAQLRTKYPHLSAAECREYSRKIVEKAKPPTQILRLSGSPSYWVQATKVSFFAGSVAFIVGGGIELVSQLLNGEADWKRVAGMGTLSGGAVGVGVLAEQALAKLAVENAIANSAVRSMATALGSTTTAMTNVLASSISGGVTAVLFAVGGYVAGYYDSYEANKAGVCGLAGTGAATAAALGTVAYATAVGTASTGVAISSLSGAAANSAAMAWLGGGAASAGGGGMATGGLVVFGVAGVAAIAAVTASYYCFSLYEKGQEKKLQTMTLKAFAQGDILIPVIERIVPMPRFGQMSF